MADAGIKFTWNKAWYGEKVAKALDTTTYKTLNHAAASLRLIAKRSMKSGKKASAPGKPPNTQTKQLPNAILYAVDRKKMVAVIGTDYNKIGTVGAAHEFGGKFRKQTYPSRPFMKPALEKVTPRLPAMWAANFKP